jgi:hypothetical protein
MRATFGPATEAIRKNPVREMENAHIKLEDWNVSLRIIDEHLAHPDVSEEEKEVLRFERALVRVGVLACMNIITACEEEMRRHAKLLRDSWGWLL